MICSECQYTDVCNASVHQHEKLKPLTQRGEKPICFECAHRYWVMNVPGGTRQCETCKIIKPLTPDSVKIKHQR